jgi:hypothetical protein
LHPPAGGFLCQINSSGPPEEARRHLFATGNPEFATRNLFNFEPVPSEKQRTMIAQRNILPENGELGAG